MAIILSESDIYHFWTHVEKSDGCWLWTAGDDGDGYGQYSVSGRAQRAHCVSWTIANGPIPDGFMVCHECDNPPCVRPDHLFLGTNLQNMIDKVEKGRQYHPPRKKGTASPEGGSGPLGHSAKLTSTDAQSIRDRYKEGEVTQRSLANEYNVSLKTISNVIRQKTFRDDDKKTSNETPLIGENDRYRTETGHVS